MTAKTAPDSVVKLLELREGWRSKTYADSKGKLTVGMGHLLTSEQTRQYPKPDLHVPETTLLQWKHEDIDTAYRAAIAQAHKIGLLDQRLINALTPVNFQLGVAWWTIFKKTWQLLLDHHWEAAAMEVTHSTWHQQTPVRVIDFQNGLRLLLTPETASTQSLTSNAS